MGHPLRATRLIGILVLVFATACDYCDVVTSQRSTSPDGRHVAVVFSHLCGFNVSLNTQVAIVPADHRGSVDANTFYAINGDTVGPFSRGGGPAAIVEWRSSDTLIVMYDNDAFIKKTEATVDGVTVRYVELAMTEPNRPSP
jgi:hypothetical protein